VDQLAQLKLKPEQIGYVGIKPLPRRSYRSGRLVSAGDALDRQGRLGRAGEPDSGCRPERQAVRALAERRGKMEALPATRMCSATGTVADPEHAGHTPGHRSLLVKLKEKGNVLLTGDLAHFRENYESNGVPTFNTSRSDTVASHRSLQEIAANFKATVIIQHDARDVGKLPAFPAAAK
jgi:hypothetical protein